MSTLEPRTFCSFLVDGMWLGIEAVKIQEIIRPQKITRIPLADPVVSGLINLRGQIVIALDLRRRLGLTPHALDARPMNIVVHTVEGAFSLQVDRIGDVFEVDARQFDRTPDTVAAAARDLIAGAYKLPDRLLLVLDTDRAVQPAREGKGDLGS